MSFWKKGQQRIPGQLNYLSSNMLLGSQGSNKIFLGYDADKQEFKNKKKENKLKSISSSDNIKISSFQVNHHNVVTGKVSPSSSIIIEQEAEMKMDLKVQNLISREDIKIQKLEVILNVENVKLDELKKISWSGIPSKYRSLSWKLLMGYAPTKQDRRLETLIRKRQEYLEYRKKNFYQNLNNEETDNLDQDIWHQISIDVPRTCPTLDIIQHEIVQRLLERVLYIWSIRHPASGYVQGINDLAIPFIIAFLKEYFEDEDIELLKLNQIELDNIEADTFWCLSKLLDGIQDNFTSAQRGIQRQLALLKYLIMRIDAPLAQHLDNENLLYVQFGFRWMNCLLMREFQLDQIIRLWDTYMSEPTLGFSHFHVYVCAAFLIHWKKQLLEMDFQEMIMFLQHLPTEDWSLNDIELLLSQAFMWSSLFADAPNHLN